MLGTLKCAFTWNAELGELKFGYGDDYSTIEQKYIQKIDHHEPINCINVLRIQTFLTKYVEQIDANTPINEDSLKHEIFENVISAEEYETLFEDVEYEISIQYINNSNDDPPVEYGTITEKTVTIPHQDYFFNVAEPECPLTENIIYIWDIIPNGHETCRYIPVHEYYETYILPETTSSSSSLPIYFFISYFVLIGTIVTAKLLYSN